MSLLSVGVYTKYAANVSPDVVPNVNDINEVR